MQRFQCHRGGIERHQDAGNGVLDELRPGDGDREERYRSRKMPLPYLSRPPASPNQHHAASSAARVMAIPTGRHPGFASCTSQVKKSMIQLLPSR